MGLKLFDCNCSYGIGSLPPLRYARNVSDLIAEMDFCGIDRGLVYHAGQRFGHPMVYNAQILKDIQGYPRLEPVWAILPAQTGEQPEPGEFIRRMKQKGIRTLRAFPDEHRYRLDSCTFGGLLELLSEKKVPLFVKANALVIGDILKDFPNLMLIAVNQGPHSLERYLRPLVEKYPNFCIETSNYIVAGLIEEFCECYGSARLLFGSGFPDNCSGGALLRLVHAEIAEESKQAIACGNLERLLDGVRL